VLWLGMDAQRSLREYVDRLEHACRAQNVRIDEQRARIQELEIENQRLIDWIMGDANAHTALQAVYNNPNSSEANRVKAAAAAINYEQGKVRDEPPVLELKAWMPLSELVPIRMKRDLELEAEQAPLRGKRSEPSLPSMDLLPKPNGNDTSG